MKCYKIHYNENQLQLCLRVWSDCRKIQFTISNVGCNDVVTNHKYTKTYGRSLKSSQKNIWKFPVNWLLPQTAINHFNLLCLAMNKTWSTINYTLRLCKLLTEFIRTGILHGCRRTFEVLAVICWIGDVRKPILRPWDQIEKLPDLPMVLLQLFIMTYHCAWLHPRGRYALCWEILPSAFQHLLKA